MHAAANTSVGQCTPSTRREKATRQIHEIAVHSANLRAPGQILLIQRAAAIPECRDDESMSTRESLNPNTTLFPTTPGELGQPPS